MKFNNISDRFSFFLKHLCTHPILFFLPIPGEIQQTKRQDAWGILHMLHLHLHQSLHPPDDRHSWVSLVNIGFCFFFFLVSNYKWNLIKDWINWPGVHGIRRSDPLHNFNNSVWEVHLFAKTNYTVNNLSIYCDNPFKKFIAFPTTYLHQEFWSNFWES